MKKTGIVWDERYLAHETGPGHPERPERLLAVKEVLDTDSGLIVIKPRPATVEEVGWVHEPAHIERIEGARGIATRFDSDTPAGPGSTDAAFLAAGGVLEAVEAVEAGRVENAFAFPRPPGHHAEADRAMGFCLFNNVAIAAAFLINQKNKKRVAIVDYDVHHGNGTQHIFYERDDVFYVSTHRFPFYPGTGAAWETGSGRGQGFTLNVPMDGGEGDAAYEKSFDETIVPALTKYRPEFILVSAGYDAHRRDPLGGMNVTAKGFHFMNQRLFEVAVKICAGKIVFVLEGGYDLKGLREGVESVLDVLRC